MRRRVLIAGWVVALGLSAILPLSAIYHGIVHIGPKAFVASGPQRAPVVAIGSDVTIGRGSRSVVVAVLGNVSIAGRTRDDVVALGGNVYLERGARVDRDVVALLGSIERGPQVTVRGRLGGALHGWNGRAWSHSRSLAVFLFKNVRLGMAAGLALLLIGTCLAIVFPWQVMLISSTLRQAPLKSGVVGLLSLLTFVFLVVPLGLSLAGLPFALLLTGAASLAWLFGMTAAAVLLGRTVSRQPMSLLWATAAGLIILALGMAVPLAGPLLVALVGLTGAGALAVALLDRANPSMPIA
jgi:hypothetical protein